MSEERDRLSNQLIKLGDMMGDGLHHEEPWISREYKKVLKLLHPEMFPKKKRKPSQKMIKTIKLCDCGAKGWCFTRYNNGNVGIKCKNCGKDSGECKDNKEAINKWNTLI